MGAIQQDTGPAQPGTTAIRSVLVVDDSRLQRRILTASLSRWGFEVTPAESAAEALKICEEMTPDLILSDWMMPGMSGVEFCQEFRTLNQDKYSYFILLTAKSDKAEVARGLEAGADDFLTKPVNADELRARITAGDRILRMERELTEKNRLVQATLGELQAVYDSLDSDLLEAKKLQQSLIRERYRDFGSADVSLMLRSSGHVGGDLVGFFPIDDRRIGLFGIDVSGHGITSALMTARLAGCLSGGSPDQNVALTKGPEGAVIPRSPADAISALNDIVLQEMETEHYFTLLLAIVDLQSGHITAAQAGHPHPAVQRRDGRIEFVGIGGLPVGLIPGATYEDFTLRLLPGDRILILSDGVTECPNPQDELLDDVGLERLMHKNASIKGNAFLEALIWDLAAFSGTEDFPDDVSGVLFEMKPAS